MAGVMPQRGQQGRESERLRLDPFVIAGGDASPRDQRDLEGSKNPLVLGLSL
ncbi:hypothetical protein [Acetobacter orientalis]|uniref:hypothetical protein n=1 Tax=Acetobacter orientalis TaxID=146474 RepID=UPI0039ED12C7